eukprot:TRINITY_DN5684_c0_g1_i1.p1 TRINITY_DN5684_c0_g1~~TRINITY_DN5684_c0_g1_i1.p1  ORF type:complete len:196 (+),score=54.89 TRINITY_DN5684_c0_g1_i1:39-626(+)
MSSAKWAQDQRRVFLSVKMMGAKAAADTKCELTPSGRIKLEVGDQTFEIQLSGEIDSNHPDTQTSFKPNSVELVIRKANKGYWAALVEGDKKDRSITVDWDKWVDEDECPDDEDDEAAGPGQMSAYEPSPIAQEEESPVNGDDSERFVRLNPNEKMLLLAHTWNKCDEDERAAAMSTSNPSWTAAPAPPSSTQPT